MIKRVTSLSELKILYNSFDESAVLKSRAALHYGGELYDTDMLWKAWANIYLIINECIIVAHFDNPDHCDGFIWFVIGPDYRVNKIIAQSYIWVSVSPLIGMKVFLEAEKLIKKRSNIDYMTMGVLQSSPVSQKFENVLCNRLGFAPEGKSFYKKV